MLLVPPLAAPASCFDLHRDCSLAQHLTAMGYPIYLVDYGPIGFHDRALGLEHWVEDVIPTAIRVASEDAGGVPVQPVGWCLGGILTLLAVAADRSLPVASVAMVASPFDFEQMRLLGPIRQLGRLTGGALVGALYRALGGAPAPLVSRAFQLTSIERYLTKPLFLATHLHDRDTIAHMEAVDAYMAHMSAYPGRTFGQLYHAFFRVNDLARGKVELRRGTRDRPGRRDRAGAQRGRRGRRAGARGGGPARGRAAGRRAAGDRTRRPPRRADRPVGEGHHLGVPGRVPGRARPGGGRARDAGENGLAPDEAHGSVNGCRGIPWSVSRMPSSYAPPWAVTSASGAAEGRATETSSAATEQLATWCSEPSGSA